ncbi:hypothetical protein K3888_02150 [Dietzia aurantiaca]|uniref:hypothetical protein n=1 Tax=Dietzia aurantiaca TaxID=983873 RepID=UPI001E3B7614|nr:hypothetical protein [Dietzia aurantiaca]MCD2261494.1 hypothetical protein [Dietzia aurantiaca]
MQFRARAFTAVAAAALLAASSGGGIALADTDDSGSGSGSGSSGSLSSSGLGLGGTIGDLAIAAEALNGPVTVTPNSGGGATVTYTNEGTENDRCVGFVTPYSTIVDGDIDVDFDKTQLSEGIKVITAIEAGPDVSILLGDEAGSPIVRADDPAVPNDIEEEVLDLLFDFNNPEFPAEAVTLTPGKSVSWSTSVPETPAAAGIVCTRGAVDFSTRPNIYFGIDKQVVADQINDKIPGGSLDVVSAGSISGGSVGFGAGALGSLAPSDEESPITPAE